MAQHVFLISLKNFLQISRIVTKTDQLRKNFQEVINSDIDLSKELNQIISYKNDDIVKKIMDGEIQKYENVDLDNKVQEMHKRNKSKRAEQLLNNF